MEVSSNWKKYMEVNWENIVCLVVLASILYYFYKVLAQQEVAFSTPSTSGGGRGSLHTRSPKSRDQKHAVLNTRPRLQSAHREGRVTRAVALDCEMVGIQTGNESMLARVSVVNSYGCTLYDTFVKPTEPVVDYRTRVSGVRPSDVENGVEFQEAQKVVADIIKGQILVGHAVKNDLNVLYLSHPRKRIRDTSKYAPFREINSGKTPSLKKLAKEILGISLQEGEHSSVEDAKAAMALYNKHRREWESGRS